MFLYLIIWRCSEQSSTRVFSSLRTSYNIIDFGPLARVATLLICIYFALVPFYFVGYAPPCTCLLRHTNAVVMKGTPPTGSRIRHHHFTVSSNNDDTDNITIDSILSKSLCVLFLTFMQPPSQGVVDLESPPFLRV